jgi:hypothetical protein
MNSQGGKRKVWIDGLKLPRRFIQDNSETHRPWLFQVGHWGSGSGGGRVERLTCIWAQFC